MQLRATRLTAIASAVRRFFSPASLFAAGEQGVWYDPSDFSRYMATGPELVVNGAFDADASSWTTGNSATFIASSGVATLTNGAASNGYAFQVIPTVPGVTYKVAFSFVAGTAPAPRMFAGSSVFSANLGIISPPSSGTYTFSFIASGLFAWISVATNSTTAGVAASFDNISVRELTALDTATLFQDAAGPTPVTAVEQPVGLMLDKSKGLVLGPELFLKTLDLADPTWIKTAAVTSSGFQSFITSAVGGVYTSVLPAPSSARFEVRLAGVTSANLVVRNENGTTDQKSVLPGAFDLTIRGRLFTEGRSIFLFLQGAGTVTISSISVRELPGNHAYQTTSTSRPVLSARYNLLTKTEQVQDIAWAKNFGAGVSVLANQESGPDGQSNMALVTSSGSGGALYQVCSIAFSVAHTMRVFVKQGTAASSQVGVFNTSAGVFVTITFGWSGGVPSTTATAGSPTDIGYTDFGGGLYLVSFSFVSRASGQHWPLYLPDATAGIGNGYAGYASLVPANQAHLPYQRVNTSTDYDADPAKFKPYLKFDGVDDFLVTNSIDFTGTNKMTVFAGVRKLSDVAAGAIVELSENPPGFQRIFSLSFPAGVGALDTARWTSRGTLAYSSVNSSSHPAPTSKILTGVADISGDVARLSVNGAIQGVSAADQGDGPFGNYPLCIGRRGGATLPFNGHLYSLIVRGAATTDAKITQTERWVANKTGVTL